MQSGTSHVAVDLDAVFEYLPAGLAVYDTSPDFRCLRHNTRFLALVGADWQAHGSIVGVPLRDLFDAESYAATRRIFAQALSTQSVITLDDYPAVLLPDPQPRYYQWSITPLLDSARQVTALLVSAVEITRRKRVEQALRESEERLRLALSAADLGTWRWEIGFDQDTRDAELNRILGLEAVASTQPLQDFIARVHPADRPEVTAAINRAVQEQSAYAAEFRIIRPDGEIRWLRDQGRVIGGPERRSPVLTGAAVDITALKRIEEMQRFLAEASALLAAPLNVDEMLNQVTRLIVPALADWCLVDQRMTDGSVQTVALAHVDPAREAALRELHERHPPDPADAFGVGLVLQTAAPQLYATPAAAAPIAAFLQRFSAVGCTSALIVPLVARGRIMGAITLATARPGRGYTAEDLPLAVDLARRAAVAIDNTRLYVAAQQARADAEAAHRRLAFLAEASSALNASLDYTAALRSLARVATPFLADWCIVDAHTDGVLRRIGGAHVDPAQELLVQQLRRYEPDANPHSPIVAVLQTGQSLLVNNVTETMLTATAQDAEHLAIVRALAPRSLLIVPLVAREQMLGVLTCVMAGSGRQYSEADLHLAEELARRAALAIDNARLYAAEQTAREAAERAADRTLHLQTVTAALSTALTPVQVAEVIVREGRAAFGADAGAVYALTDAERMFELLAFTSYPPQASSDYAHRIAEQPGPLGDAVRTRNLVITQSPEDLLMRWPRLAAVQAEAGDAATITMPLIIDHHILGTFYLAFRAPRRFKSEDRALAATLARLGAQALERARLYEAERQARADAEGAVRARDVFLSIASHELKTPLTALLGHAQLLQRRARREDSFAERDLRAVQVMFEQADRLNRMVSALLDISRIEQGQLSIERSPLDLTTLIRRQVEETQPTLHKHTIVCTTPDELLLVEGDAIRLGQVLQNLLGNAVKYSPAGGVIEVRVERRAGLACVVVRDEGIGIPAAALPNLGRRFYRAPNAEKRQIIGMGIGLYVVREIISRHGGTVEVESVEGEGSAFTICLPLAGVAGERPEPPAGG